MQETSNKQKIIAFSNKGKQVTYILNDEDYLTLLRAVEFEGSPKNAVAWTFLQRFAFVYPTYTSLDKLIKAYSQPINPAWFPDGNRHKAYVKLLEGKGRDKEALEEIKRAEKRISKASTPISKISIDTINAVNKVFETNISPVPGSVHFRAPTIQTNVAENASIAQKEFAKIRNLIPIPYGNIIKENWLFESPGSKGFSIVASLGGITKAGNIAVSLLILGGIGASIYLVNRFA